MLTQLIRSVLPLAGCVGILGVAGVVTSAPRGDAIADLQKDVEAGTTELPFEPTHGYLKGILKHLEVPESSQVLVFSKTSLQSRFISPERPRAIYFNDHTYVGWVNGGEFIEIASVDPVKGTRFYTIRNSQQVAPRFDEENSRCVLCHTGPGLGGAPSLVAKSVYADRTGDLLYRAGAHKIDSTTPLRDRWGGWYVTGSHGKQRHMGNTYATGSYSDPVLDTEVGANIPNLDKLVNSGEYLNGHSDIVALMVLEHQMQVQNLITKTAVSVRRDEPIEESCEPLVEAILCVGEPTFTSPIKGSSTFQKEYESGGVKDRSGRSFKALDLQNRLFRYSFSPMVHSASFFALPKTAKDRIGLRLLQILNGNDKSPKFQHLSTGDRKAILAILTDTMPGLLPAKAQ